MIHASALAAVTNFKNLRLLVRRRRAIAETSVESAQKLEVHPVAVFCTLSFERLQQAM